MSKILITGARGFIGSYLVNSLRTENLNIIAPTIKSLDVRNKASFFKFKDVSIVYHLAAVNKSNSEEEFYSINVDGTENTLEFCRKSNTKIIFASSAAVYGIQQYLPVNEEHPLNPVSAYGRSKVKAEAICKKYSEDYGINCTILRIFNTYGKGQKPEFLIPTILNQIARGNKIIAYNPEFRRDFIYIEDVVEALHKSLKLKGFNILNVGFGKSYSVSDIINTIKKIIGQDFDIKYITKDEPVKDIFADINKANQLLKWWQKINIEKGLRRMLEN